MRFSGELTRLSTTSAAVRRRTWNRLSFALDGHSLLHDVLMDALIVEPTALAFEVGAVILLSLH